MELKGATTPDLVARHFCLNWNPNDPLIPLYQAQALQFNSHNDPSLAALILVDLQNRALLYYKNQCGDCGSASGPAGGVNPVAAANLGIGTTEQLGTTFLKAGTKLASAIPIVGNIADIVVGIVGAFTQAHAQAVAREQAVNCQASLAFAQTVPLVDQAVASGQVTASVGIQSAAQYIDTISQGLGPVVSGKNWGWGAQQRLLAHKAFRVAWYPQLANTAATSPTAALSEALSGAKKNPALLLGGGAVVAAKVFGLF